MTATAYQDTFASDNLPPRDLWPELCFDLPQLHYPDRLNCVGELLDKMVDSGFADKVAIYGRDDSWTYAQLQQKVNQIALVLRDDLALPTGSRVLLRGSNSPMMAACTLAVMKAGYIAVPTMPLLRTRELIMILDKAQVAAALCCADLQDEMEQARGQSACLRSVLYFHASGDDALEPRMSKRTDAAAGNAAFHAVNTAAEDICLIGFTSGTTGIPKGTMHFHRDMLAICDCFPQSILQIQESDIFIGTPPLAFTFGLGGLLLFPLRVGASTVLLDKLTPQTLLQAIQTYRATVCFTAPTFYRQMAVLAADVDLSSLRASVSAGEFLPVVTRESWLQASGLQMIDGIGSTEMLHIFISAAADGVRPGAMGKSVAGYRACVLDAEGREVAPGVVGRLAVKGPTGCRYLADQRQSDYVCNGWNLTGDACSIDADGYFWYQARTDDMIVSSGYNIAGPEVEEALLAHPSVAECAVVGMADEARGQIVKAFVVLQADAMSSVEIDLQVAAAMVKTLQDFVKQRIAPYKYPRAITFCRTLPRTESGKLQRYKLRDAGDNVGEDAGHSDS